MKLGNVETIRSKLPRPIKQLIYWMQRRNLERTAGRFHATWADLEWRIWALDSANQGEGMFEPLIEGSDRRYLRKPSEALRGAITRLSPVVDLTDELEELNRERNRVIHGTITPNDIRHPNLHLGPKLMSSKIMGVTWPETYIVPMLQAMERQKREVRERYTNELDKSDILDLTKRVKIVSRELDERYLRKLQSDRNKLIRKKIEDWDAHGWTNEIDQEYSDDAS